MNSKIPIFVISKGRYDNCLTAKILKKSNIDFRLVVEPKEKDLYYKHKEKLIILPSDFSELNKGSVPVRNWVWNYSKKQGFTHHWIIDDNIEGLNRLNNNMKNETNISNYFKIMEDFVFRYKNIAIAGPNYYSFCKSTDKIPPFYSNTRVYSCLLINNSIPFRWRGKYNEDTDLCIRVLKKGYCTILFNSLLIGKVTTLRMKGGNENIYSETNNRLEFAQSLADQHPDVVKVTKKFGRFHHQVNYKPFKKNKLEFIDGYTQPKEKINNYGMKLINKE